MKEVSLEVKDVHIVYKMMQKFSIQRNLIKRDAEKAQVFEAVRGITFTAEKGEIIGIIGKNGSGKSTLLRAIAGVFSPNEGTIDLKGNSVSLLSLGVGFKDSLTGRENIYLSGMLLGFTEKEIKEKEQAIVDFAEIGEFIDRPVKTYSSGMRSKLTFAITSCLETDIMLVDEVLSVGDEHFKKKSLARMVKLINDDNRTVIIVSHNIETLEKLCTRVMWMNDGVIVEMGDPHEVLAHYKEFMNQ